MAFPPEGWLGCILSAGEQQEQNSVGLGSPGVTISPSLLEVLGKNMANLNLAGTLPWVLHSGELLVGPLGTATFGGSWQGKDLMTCPCCGLISPAQNPRSCGCLLGRGWCSWLSLVACSEGTDPLQIG